MDQTWNPICFEFRNTLGLGHVLESHPWDRLWVETARKEERSQMRFKFWEPMPELAGSIINFNILISYRHRDFFLSFVHIDMIQVWGLSSFSHTRPVSINIGKTWALDFNVFWGHLARCNMCFDGGWRFEKWNAYIWWTFHFFKMPIFIFFLFLFFMIFSRYPLGIMGFFLKRRRAWWFYSP